MISPTNTQTHSTLFYNRQRFYVWMFKYFRFFCLYQRDNLCRFLIYLIYLFWLFFFNQTIIFNQKILHLMQELYFQSPIRLFLNGTLLFVCNHLINGFKYFYPTLIIICLYTVIWIQIFLSNTDNLNADVCCPVDWGCRIHRLHICRGVRPPPNEWPGYDTKQSDDEVSVMQELWGMRSTPSLPSLTGPVWPGMVAPWSNGTKLRTELFKIELFLTLKQYYAKLNCS